MPSSLNVRTGADAATSDPVSNAMPLPRFLAPGTPVSGDDVVAQSWVPAPLCAAAPSATRQSSSAAFEPTSTDRPAWASFEVSREVGIPDDVLEAARVSARAAGYATGWASGVADARTAANAQLAARQQTIDAEMAELQQQRHNVFGMLERAGRELAERAVTSATDIEQQIISVAFDIAEALVGQSLIDDEFRAPAALQRALALAPQDHDVTVSVAAQDFAILAASVESSVDGAEIAGTAQRTSITRDEDVLVQRRGAHEVKIVLDRSLVPGDAIARSGATTIDARLSTALQRVREVIAP